MMLNPGSPEAVSAGCTCAVLDNGYGTGSGYLNPDGSSAFWINKDCPLHGIDVTMKQKEKTQELIDKTVANMVANTIGLILAQGGTKEQAESVVLNLIRKVRRNAINGLDWT